MKTYYLFLKQNYEPVLFGSVLTLFSSLGQTFFISLFVPDLLQEFNLSKGVFGGYYALATIISSLFLLQYGYVIDHRPIRSLTLKAVLLLTVSGIIMGLSVHPAMAFIGLVGLRLAGQGLMCHISLTVISRYFNKDRGKGLSLSSLGFSFGEMIFPLLTSLLILSTNWRNGLIAIVLASMVILLIILKRINVESMDLDPNGPKEKAPLDKWRYFLDVMKEKIFWAVAGPIFFLSFVVTGIFFYQFLLAEEKNWPMEWYAACFVISGFVRLVFSLYGEALTDRLSARAVYPYHLLPLIIGILTIVFVPGKLAALTFLLLTSTSVGLNGVLKSAVIAEIYGVDRIGTIRSLFTVIMVLSTAAGPVLFGTLLDAGLSFAHIIFVSVGLLSLAMLNSFRIRNQNSNIIFKAI